ncbi:MAG: VWA domain-containing protein [Acetobacteraceae bacterium]|nr:VWA domain-containing protein [Acetobacteraceae bacterium]
MRFAHVLRRAGLPVGPAETMAAQRALSLVDLGNRMEARAALRGTMVHRHEHADVFDHAFSLFWRDPAAGDRARAMAALEGRPEPQPVPAAPTARRVGEALAASRPRVPPEDETPPRRDAALTVSERERLGRMDFEAMSAAEIANAKAEIRRLTLPLDRRPTRRLRPDPIGRRIDLRRTVRASLRQGGEILSLARSRRTLRAPPLVVLCDISGSMARYAPILLHFLHAVSSDRARVHAFLFGTRLSNITRQLRHRDPEIAFQLVAASVPDWSGGTRIGDALTLFNRRWGKRVLAEGATVLLITDGLDRPRADDAPDTLAAAMERLRRSSRRLIWLNPLLRWSGFEAKSKSIRAMLPHVDAFRPVHNLDSLRALVRTLSEPDAARGRA